MVDLNVRLGTTFGCGLVGITLAQFLYGVSFSQTFYYFSVYRGDSMRLKSLVAWWMLLATAKQAVSLQAIYSETISNHAKLKGATKLPIAYGVQNAIGWLLIFSIQCFYVHKINQILCHHKYRKLFVRVTVRVQTSTLQREGVRAHFHTDHTDDLNAFHRIRGNRNRCLYHVRSVRAAKSRLHSPTASLVNRLIKYNAERGMALCMVQLIVFAFFVYDLQSKTTNTAGVIYYLEFSVYVNSTLAVLNVRKHMRKTLVDNCCVEIMPKECATEPVGRSDGSSSGSDRVPTAER
ncbi:uncharacterized protein B0H18DRAFT_84444 [Fomitopsis serialis]|uniref:uncharacterized protein n=1 Tax=Fomitopsis serialis TaxID=139415 RepID=UPI002008B8D0|nr:uncharacterized protein B0H18DRAFT_84444 [Neoantrodia serialis]KAH9931453.1 hypothetical protein B0H18DRAFT_84444 [Neoantrodia serialis]